MYIGCSKGAVAQGNFSWILPRNFPLIAICKQPYNTFLNLVGWLSVLLDANVAVVAY